MFWVPYKLSEKKKKTFFTLLLQAGLYLNVTKILHFLKQTEGQWKVDTVQ